MNFYKKEYHLPPIEFVKFQLYQSINVPIPLMNETNITIMAYIYLYNDKARLKIIEDRILTSVNSCTNYISVLVNQGYVVRGEGKELSLNPKIHISDEDFTKVIIVKKDKTSNEVYHPYFKDPNKG